MKRFQVDHSQDGEDIRSILSQRGLTLNEAFRLAQASVEGQVLRSDKHRHGDPNRRHQARIGGRHH